MGSSPTSSAKDNDKMNTNPKTKVFVSIEDLELDENLQAYIEDYFYEDDFNISKSDIAFFIEHLSNSEYREPLYDKVMKETRQLAKLMMDKKIDLVVSKKASPSRSGPRS